MGEEHLEPLRFRLALGVNLAGWMEQSGGVLALPAESTWEGAERIRARRVITDRSDHRAPEGYSSRAVPRSTQATGAHGMGLQ